MRGSDPSARTYLLRDLAIAFGAWLASGMVPALVITLQSLVVRDADATVAFALRIAEPVSLVGAAGVVALARATGWRAGLRRGALAAAVVALGAARVGDVDAWTAAAALLLPLVGVIAARKGVVEGRAPSAPVRAADALPHPPAAPVETRACATSDAERA